MRPTMPRLITLAAIGASLIAVAWQASQRVATEAIASEREDPEAVRAAAGYLTSTACRSCHPDHVKSWRRTFHSTMTQDAKPWTVVAPFDGRTVSLLGVDTVVSRRGSSFVMETESPATGEREELAIVRCTGSRRMQQYETRMGDRLVRLPVAWSIEENRWFHLNEAFFSPDAPFRNHSAVWDLNCIFCHAVKARPGATQRGTIESSVAEIGIACEACHGPGEEHARLMRSPARRYRFHSTGEADPTIVQPGRLSQKRSSQVCGHCHGNRVPAEGVDVVQVFLAGDPYTPGEDLSRWWSPIERDTVAEGVTFEHRFWRDGSPRLTAYEYQGMLASPCHAGGEMTCLSCHSMHASDPKGQLRPDLPGDEQCLQCHADFRGDALPAHSGHAADSPGSRCVACHMPPVVYGVMTWHPTHRITSPDPAALAAQDVPDACTTCHVGRSVAWAAEQRERMWPRGAAAPLVASDRRRVESARALFAGDAVRRTLAAARLGEPDAPEPEAARLAVPLLAQALVDPYPNVRRTAAISLRRLTGRADVPDALAPLDRRERARDALSSTAEGAPVPEGWPFHPDGTLDLDLLQEMRSSREEVDVVVGE